MEKRTGREKELEKILDEYCTANRGIKGGKWYMANLRVEIKRPMFLDLSFIYGLVKKNKVTPDKAINLIISRNRIIIRKHNLKESKDFKDMCTFLNTYAKKNNIPQMAYLGETLIMPYRSKLKLKKVE